MTRLPVLPALLWLVSCGSGDALVLWTSGSWTPGTKARAWLTVHDSTGTPRQGVPIEVHNKSGTLWSGTTDQDGVAAITMQNPGHNPLDVRVGEDTHALFFVYEEPSARAGLRISEDRAQWVTVEPRSGRLLESLTLASPDDFAVPTVPATLGSPVTASSSWEASRPGPLLGEVWVGGQLVQQHRSRDQLRIPWHEEPACYRAWALNAGKRELVARSCHVRGRRIGPRPATTEPVVIKNRTVTLPQATSWVLWRGSTTVRTLVDGRLAVPLAIDEMVWPIDAVEATEAADVPIELPLVQVGAGWTPSQVLEPGTYTLWGLYTDEHGMADTVRTVEIADQLTVAVPLSQQLVLAVGDEVWWPVELHQPGPGTPSVGLVDLQGGRGAIERHQRRQVLHWTAAAAGVATFRIEASLGDQRAETDGFVQHSLNPLREQLEVRVAEPAAQGSAVVAWSAKSTLPGASVEVTADVELDGDAVLVLWGPPGARWSAQGAELEQVDRVAMVYVGPDTEQVKLVLTTTLACKVTLPPWQLMAADDAVLDAGAPMAFEVSVPPEPTDAGTYESPPGLKGGR